MQGDTAPLVHLISVEMICVCNLLTTVSNGHDTILLVLPRPRANSELEHLAALTRLLCTAFSAAPLASTPLAKEQLCSLTVSGDVSYTHWFQMCVFVLRGLA